MKRFFISILFLPVVLFVESQTFSPPSFADIDNNYRTHVNQVFGALEANRVTTGLLVGKSQLVTIARNQSQTHG